MEQQMFTKIEQIEHSVKALEPALQACERRLERLSALSALKLWEVNTLSSALAASHTKPHEDAASLIHHGHQLAYEAGLKSEHLLRLLFQLDSIMGSDEVRARRKKTVLYIKDLMARFDQLRARALNLESVYANRILKKAGAADTSKLQTDETEEMESEVETEMSSPPANSGSTKNDKLKQTKKGKKSKKGKKKSKKKKQDPAGLSIKPTQTVKQDFDDEGCIEEVPVDDVLDTETEMPVESEEVVDEKKNKDDTLDEAKEDQEVEESKEDEGEGQPIEGKSESMEGGVQVEPLELQVARLRKERPDLEFRVPLHERDLADGVILYAELPGVDRQNLSVKADPQRRTLNIFGLRRGYERIDELSNLFDRGFFGGSRAWPESTHKPVTQWFTEQLQLPSTVDAAKMRVKLWQDGKLQIALPYTAAKRRQVEQERSRRAPPMQPTDLRDYGYPPRDFGYQRRRDFGGYEPRSDFEGYGFPW
eukprot:gb/GEZN01004170.1/.p1 GENE.gb/GEZN01004170.1/~~gb/GEZN01004170.1/.p1  ORF type:complete len:479 (+),score=94.78 gb/GEZN01004170.1/:87-1523(+)